MRGTVVWDNHCCLPLRADATFLPQLERYRRAGVNVVSLNVGMADIPLLEHLRVLSYMRQWIAQRPERYCLVASLKDIERCKTERKLGIVFDVEGMSAIQDDPSFVQTFYELGVRWMLIAYNQPNRAGGGCLGEDGGLTALGRSVIDEMERVGMVLCLSHAGSRTAAEALEHVRNPPIFSHSNPHGHTPHPRNVSAELMRACARKGGVVGLTGFGPFLGAGDGLLERLLSQLRYAIALIGAEHVGISLDYVFDQSELEALAAQKPGLFPENMLHGPLAMLGPEIFPSIAEELAKDGLTDVQIRGVLGANWLRVATRVWR